MNTEVIKIGKIKISENHKPLIIAEIGINHNGNLKLAKKIADEQNKINKKIKVFLQINVGDEDQKSGINKAEANQLVAYCKEIGLDLIGLMCIPPVNIDPNDYFKEMNEINNSFSVVELSMGMSSDYLIAVSHSATYIRIGSNIFGTRN